VSRHLEIKTAAEESLLAFIRLVAGHRVLGDIHKEICRWWTRDEALSHQLLLLPRDHQKSALVAYRVAWEITRNPAVTILYISSTSNLAEKQLKFIKDILTSNVYRRYWPEMINEEEGKRSQWTLSEIAIDHPIRVKEGIRDPTIFTAGLTTSITGLHCNIAVLDDVVVQENAYTKDGRNKVKEQYSLLASIETTDAEEWVVGTRYHPDDLYNEMIEMLAETYDIEGEVASQTPIYEVMQREVESTGDGTGEYLWPRQQRKDGKWYGFDQKILAKKRAQYLDKSQYRAQYYNNPNDPDNEKISATYFQYYDKRFLSSSFGVWSFGRTSLHVYAAIDFAFSLSSKADFTALVVIGINSDGHIYVLDIYRFKSNRISDYFDTIIEANSKWGFRKLRAEVTIAQEAIVEELKDRIRRQGCALSIDKYRPTRTEGTKEERIHSILAPRYENQTIWHYEGGYTSDLEEELKQERPKHDDIKDALACAVAIAKPPVQRRRENIMKSNVITHVRFGGIAA
jgi:hypothetical protein